MALKPGEEERLHHWAHIDRRCVGPTVEDDSIGADTPDEAIERIKEAVLLHGDLDARESIVRVRPAGAGGKEEPPTIREARYDKNRSKEYGLTDDDLFNLRARLGNKATAEWLRIVVVFEPG